MATEATYEIRFYDCTYHERVVGGVTDQESLSDMGYPGLTHPCKWCLLYYSDRTVRRLYDSVTLLCPIVTLLRYCTWQRTKSIAYIAW